jgi:hypothetical protein
LPIAAVCRARCALNNGQDGWLLNRLQRQVQELQQSVPELRQQIPPIKAKLDALVEQHGCHINGDLALPYWAEKPSSSSGVLAALQAAPNTIRVCSICWRSCCIPELAGFLTMRSEPC